MSRSGHVTNFWPVRSKRKSAGDGNENEVAFHGKNNRISDTLILFSNLGGRVGKWRCSHLGTMGQNAVKSWTHQTSHLVTLNCWANHGATYCQLAYHEMQLTIFLLSHTYLSFLLLTSKILSNTTFYFADKKTKPRVNNFHKAIDLVHNMLRLKLICF